MASAQMHALEPRIMFDGAGLATGLDAAASIDPAHAADLVVPEIAAAYPVVTASPLNEIVFVDTRVPDYQAIIAGIGANIEVVLLDAGRDGVGQIAEALDGRSGIDAIHIVSHGDEGMLFLGSGALHAGNLGTYADSLAGIGSALGADGDILLYGCEVASGETGAAFVAQLAAITGADIAASDDLTGGADLGGDSDLEVTTGAIETAILSVPEGVVLQYSPGSEDLSEMTSGAGGTSNYFLAGDFDDDGDVDIVFSNDGINNAYYENDGNGNFTYIDSLAGTPFAGLPEGPTWGPNRTAQADFDGDSDLDIFYYGSSHIYLENNSDGTYSNVALASSPLSAIPAGAAEYFLAGDWDNDGDVDVVYWTGSGTAAGYLRNDGSSGFTQIADMTSTPFSGVVAPIEGMANTQVADFDGDGDQDILFFHPASSTNYYLQNDDGSFSNQPSPFSALPTSVAAGGGTAIAGDFDSDGDVDLLYWDSGVNKYYRNDGGGSFTHFADTTGTPFEGVADLPDWGPGHAALADFDGDGDLDMLYRFGSGTETDQALIFQGGAPPELLTATPADNATDVALDANVVLTFNETVTTGSGFITLRRSDTDAVVETFAATDPRVTGSGTDTITVNFAANLEANTGYYLQIGAGAFVDSDGMSIGQLDGIQRTAITDPGFLNFQTVANLPPVIDANGAAAGTTNSVNFSEVGSAVRIVTSDATLTDDDDITGMTLVLSATPNGAAESISYNAALNGAATLASLGLTGAYDSGTRTYTLSGTASVATYQAVLRAMVYDNTSDAPGTAARTVTITATDAEGASGQTTATIGITAVNDAPTATNLTQSKAATEGGSAVALDDIVVTDPDGTDTITATLTLSNPTAGTLSTGTFGSATSTFNAGTGVWNVTGSVADVNAALAAVALTPSANNDQNFTITTRIRDAAGTGPADGTISVEVTATNDAPVVVASSGTTAFTEGGAAVAIDAGLTLADIDSTTLASATVAITGNFQAQDLLGFVNDGATMGNITARRHVPGLRSAARPFVR